MTPFSLSLTPPSHHHHYYHLFALNWLPSCLLNVVFILTTRPFVSDCIVLQHLNRSTKHNQPCIPLFLLSSSLSDTTNNNVLFKIMSSQCSILIISCFAILYIYSHTHTHIHWFWVWVWVCVCTICISGCCSV